MIQRKKYKYQGVNGSIISTILLEGIAKIELLELQASEGKVLTDGKNVVKTALIPAENLSKWSEIADELDK